MSQLLLEQKLKQLEKKVEEHGKEIKDLERRVSGHDTSIAKIELMVESLKSQWTNLERDIRKAVETTQNNTHQAWKEVTIEAIKTIGVVAGAILAAKIFLG